MTRPRKLRRLGFLPSVYYYKPRGIPLSQLNEVILKRDELEALKLHDVDKMEQIEAAKKMEISQPTFGRILDGAYKKIARAIIEGRAIRIEKTLE